MPPVRVSDSMTRRPRWRRWTSWCRAGGTTRRSCSGSGNDAGLYLGTVIVRTVPGAAWDLRSDGQPVIRLESGREFDVVASGHEWAASGVPELSQLYAEVAEE
ncbi:hypothetical protein RKD46_001988 [Streptomyces pseudovenezuelae]